MFQRKLQRNYGIGLVAIALLVGSAAQAQILDEDFDSVSGSGGGIFLVGPGFAETNDWDTGISGENAFAGAEGNADIGSASADGLPSGGVAGSGAGAVSVSGVIYDLLNEDFEGATGTGSATFLVGGAGADTSSYTAGWDLGLEGEAAFAGTFDGAVLNGSVTAEAIIGGGNPGNAGSIDVDDVTINSGGWYAGLQFEIGALPGGIALGNPGFEGPSAWTGFSNAYELPDPIEIAPRTGNAAAKMFGAFNGPSGLYQDFSTEEGQMITFSAYAFAPSADPIAASSNQAQLRIEWRDASDAVVLVDTAVVLDPADPNFVEDTWVQGSVSGTAPAGAVVARVLLWFEQPSSDGGAVWWDDANIEVTGPGSVDISGFALNADVRGAVDAAGEALGTIQLRIEDSDGDRLLKNVAATGSYTAIGGTLDTFTEADSTGAPASGVFNPNSSYFRVVVAFEDVATWNAGGTIDVDNLVLANDNIEGSAWYAGMFFDGLSIPILDPNAIVILDPNKVVMLADVKGSKAAPYALRLEAIDQISSALNESFSDVAADCGTGDPNDCLLLDLNAGETTDYSLNIDSNLPGFESFAGVAGSIFPTFTDPGVFVETLPTGGIDGTGGLQIRVQGIVRGADGSWYAGVAALDQALASSDLSQVTLSADLKGTADAFGGLGVIGLRLEDANGDRLEFDVTATGAWQHVGGTLDTATELPAADGQGDGVFNVDDGTYTVVVAFEQPVPDVDNPVTWDLGGVVEIDNLYLTPATSNIELGRYEFVESGSTSYDKVGGFVTAADTQSLDTEGDPGSAGGTVTLDFEDGVPAGLQQINNAPWDAGLDNENLSWGGPGVVGQIETCATCGVGGSQAVHGILTQGSDWWYLVIFFNEVPLDLSGGDGGVGPAGLSDVSLEAQIKSLDANSLGLARIRIEDESAGAGNTDTLEFDLTLTDSFQMIGGTLDNFVESSVNSGSGGFDYTQEKYTVTIAFAGDIQPPAWTAPVNIVVDDIVFTGAPTAGVAPPAPDFFTVTATFADETTQWGDGGELAVDNVLLAVVPNCNGDQSLDMRDLAKAQICASTPGCACADLDGDGDADGDDNIPDAFGLSSSLVMP